MKQFEHPNLLPCLTSLVVGGQVWVVTPLAEWARSVELLHTAYSSLFSMYYLLNLHTYSVRDLLRHETFRSGLPELAICLVLRDLCHALDYLHHQGVVHRAVRASHILGEELLIIGV